MEALRDRIGQEFDGDWKRLRDVLREWHDLDLVVFQHGFDITAPPPEEYAAAAGPGLMVLAARQFELPKAIVLHSITNDNSWQASAGLRALCIDLHLPLFLSIRGAATAIKRLIDFHTAHPDWIPHKGAAEAARPTPFERDNPS
jgi:hypothetical protein